MTAGLKRCMKDALAGVTARLLPVGLMRDKRYFDLWQQRGFHVTVNHFYEPVPDTRLLASDMFGRERMPAGIDMNEDRQLALLEDFARRFRLEYDQFPERLRSGNGFYLRNNAFEEVDAEILYCMVRSARPKRIIEIGSGFSTMLMAQAIEQNSRGGGHACRLTSIDPFPNKLLCANAGCTNLIRKPVQKVDPALFELLGENDLLFIDSSHVLKIGSDVHFEFLEILPRLRPGVLVHIHDIFIPREYPEQWIRNNRWFWSEQYLLEAFLAFNRAFEVVWAGRYMHLRHSQALGAAFRSYQPANGLSERSWPASFWIRRVC